MQRYLITGGAGFIGSNLARALARKPGARVAVFDNFSTGRAENLRDLRGRVRVIRADLRSAKAVMNAVKKDDIIFHQGALPSVQRSIEDPHTTWDVNVGGTVNLLNAAVKKKARRVLLASSSSVYGNLPGLPKNENVELNPLSPYAASKLACEALMQSYCESYGLETVCLRYFNVFGPWQDPASEYAAVIPRFITRMLAGKRPVIFGDGEQSRDFTYIDNVVAGNLLAARSRRAVGKVMNLSCGSTHTLLELVASLNAILKKNIDPVFAPPRSGEVRHSYADIRRARALLGYTPAVRFREGLARTAAFFMQPTAARA